MATKNTDLTLVPSYELVKELRNRADDFLNDPEPKHEPAFLSTSSCKLVLMVDMLDTILANYEDTKTDVGC